MDGSQAPVNAQVDGGFSKEAIVTAGWIQRIRALVRETPMEFAAPVTAFRDMVYKDPGLCSQAERMFADAYAQAPITPFGRPSLENFDEFLGVLNLLMHMAHESDHDIRIPFSDGSTGVVIDVLLDWPLATEAGHRFFSNMLVNQQFSSIRALLTTCAMPIVLASEAEAPGDSIDLVPARLKPSMTSDALTRWQRDISLA